MFLAQKRQKLWIENRPKSNRMCNQHSVAHSQRMRINRARADKMGDNRGEGVIIHRGERECHVEREN